MVISDLDFLVDSRDADLLYKHILEAICSNPDRVRYGINRYTLDLVVIHTVPSGIIYCNRYNSIDIGRIDKYAMELQ
jgi:hypothetical protein